MLIDCYARRRSATSRSSVLYNKLPEQPLLLSVLKLDGSCFEIQVMKSATVAQVRQAVEEVFSHMADPAEISWPHVWGHFCLCYEGQKLLLDTEYIGKYHIRDGDQLQFIRHISTNHSPSTKLALRCTDASEQSKISRLSTNYKKEDESDREGHSYHSCDDEDNGIFCHLYEENDGVAGHDGLKWSRIVRPWSPHATGLPVSEERQVFKVSSNRSSTGFLGRFRKFMKFCRSNR